MPKRNQAGQRGASAPGPERPGWRFLVAGGLIYAGALLGMWIVLAGQPDVQDLVAGSAAAVLAVGVGYLLSQRGKMVPSIRVADLRTLAALPWQLVVEIEQVFALAARKAAGRPAAPGVVNLPSASGRVSRWNLAAASCRTWSESCRHKARPSAPGDVRLHR